MTQAAPRNNLPKVSLIIGVAQLFELMAHHQDLVVMADAVPYEAKCKGRDRVAIGAKGDGSNPLG